MPAEQSASAEKPVSVEKPLSAEKDGPVAGGGDVPFVRFDKVSKTFRTPAGPVPAVRDVSFEVPRGSTLGLVGESGSGKSTVARLLMGLQRPSSGAVTIDGTNPSTGTKAELAALRRRAQMVFQNPYGSLLPHFSAVANVAEPLRLHGIGTSSQRIQRAAEMLDRVGVPAASAQLYPRQFSGGQQQRIAIARALILEPELLVCDEPTSSLDVSVQAQILALLERLRDDLGLTCVFISHNLAVVERMATTVVVMCRGRIVEMAPRRELYARPEHPYTRELLSATLPIESDPPHFERTDDADPAALGDLGGHLVQVRTGHYVRVDSDRQT